MLGLDSTKRDKNGKPYTHYAKGAELIRAVVKVLVDGLQRGETIEVRGFGKFIPTLRAPRKAPFILNPTGRGGTYTGASVTIPARLKVIFKPSPSLEAWVNLNRKGELTHRHRDAVANWELHGYSDEGSETGS